MAFTPATVRAQIASQLAAVDGIGKIYPQRKRVLNEQTARALLYVPAQDRINGWMISFAGNNVTVTDRKPGYSGIGSPGGGHALQVIQFQIEGYFGLDDVGESEQTFSDLAWNVTQRFNSLGKLSHDVVDDLPCDIEQFGYAMFAQMYLLHYCRISFGVRGKIL